MYQRPYRSLRRKFKHRLYIFLYISNQKIHGVFMWHDYMYFLFIYFGFFRQIIIVCDYHIYWWKFHISFNFLIQQYFQESTSCFSDVVHIKGEVKLKSSTKSTLINQKWKANVGSLSVAVSIHVFSYPFK